jgi:superfamily II DNA or RNA helicase
MKFEIRPYQKEAVDAARDCLRKNRAGIIKMATGLGKTVVAACIVESAVSNKKRVLFMAHTDELVFQAGDKISRSTGILYSTEKASLHAHDTLFPLVIASVQSLTRDNRLMNYPRDFFDVIITDEVHRGAAESYVRIYNHFSSAKLIGLTATPFRSDDKSLGDVYDEVCYDYGLDKAIKDGWLVPIISETIPVNIDLSKVAVSHGDYQSNDIATAVEPIFEEIASILKQKAFDRKLCAFLPLVSSAEKFSATLNRHGFDSEHVSGKSKDRAEIIHRFSHKGSGSVICNSSLLTEGWDEPSVDCVVDLTPTRSTLRYIQKIGRGTRLFLGKKNLYVPDFLWHGATHNLCRPSVLFAQTKEEADKAQEVINKGGVFNVQDVVRETSKVLKSNREEALAASLKSFIGAKSQKFDPVLQAISVFDGVVIDRNPDDRPIDEYQEAYLSKAKFDTTGWSHKYAEQVIDVIKDRISKKLCTVAQARCLIRNGYANAYSMTFVEAIENIDKLSHKWNRMRAYKKRRK